MSRNRILNYDKFSDFLQSELVKNSHFKRGDKKDLAMFINIHPTSLSQVLSGIRSFTEEQVFLLGEFLNLNEIENQYVFILHQISCAQSKNYKERLLKRKNLIKKKSLNLSHRLDKDKNLSDEEKAVFYSAWYYASVWNFISLDGGRTKEEVVDRFNLEKRVVNEILEFLISAEMAYQQNGKYYHKIGRLHLDRNSPFLKQHHANWRIKSIQKRDLKDNEDLAFTGPLSLSKKDFDFLREEMIQLIKKVSDTVAETNPEEIYCFNLDFFKI